MEQEGIAHISIHDVCSVVRVLIISSVEVVITRDIHNFHVSSHEWNATVAWKANEEVKLHTQPLFLRIIEEEVVKPFFLSLRRTSQYDRRGLVSRLLCESGHVIVRKELEPSNSEVLVLSLLEIACIANKEFLVCINLVDADEVVVVWRVSYLK